MSNVRVLSSVPEPTLAQIIDGHTRPVGGDWTAHPDDCLFCAAGEGSLHTYEPPVVDVRDVVLTELSALAKDTDLVEIPWRF